MSKMLPLPVALTPSEFGCISSGQGDPLLFVKSAAMGLNSTSNTSSSLSQHLKTFYQATGEKKSILPTSSAYFLCDCPLGSADGYHKDKNGPLDSEQNPIFKIQAQFKHTLSTLQQHHLGREATFYNSGVHCMSICPHQTSVIAEGMMP